MNLFFIVLSFITNQNSIRKLSFLLLLNIISLVIFAQEEVQFFPESEKFTFTIKEKQNIPFKNQTFYFSAQHFDDKIYAFFNEYVYEYDLIGDTWKKLKKIPKNIWCYYSVLVGDKIYLAGAGIECYSDFISVYNIKTNKFEENIKIAKHYNLAKSIGDNIVFVRYNDEIKKESLVVDVYDIKSNKMSTKSNISAKNLLGWNNSLVYKEELYLWNYNNFYKYNLEKDQWINLEKDQWIDLSDTFNFTKDRQEGLVYQDKFLFISGKDNKYKSETTKKLYFIYMI